MSILFIAELEKLYDVTVNERLKRWREAWNLNQDALALSIGVARPTLAGYEKDNNIPQKVMNKLVALGFDPEQDNPEVIRPRASISQIRFVINILASPNISDEERRTTKFEILSALGLKLE